MKKLPVLMFFSYVCSSRGTPIVNKNFGIIDLDFIKTISLKDIYSFIAYCQTVQMSSAGTRARKIVSIRQFWKYLKTKAHLIENNITEELETPKLPDILTVIGKGNKERKIFLTPAAKKSINSWMRIRNTLNVETKALFISRNGGRITTRAVQNIVKKYVIASGLDLELSNSV